MAFELSFDMSAFEKFATQTLGAALDQLPYALSRTLNDSVFHAREALVQTWPRFVNARNPNFISAALHVERSSKQNLVASIYDQLGDRGHLLELARGGTVTPTKSRMFAIPVSPDIRRGARGVRQSDRPRSLVTNNRRSVRVTRAGIFVGKGGRLRLVYAFKPSVAIPKRWPAYDVFADVMLREMAANFAGNVRLAMSTRR